MRHFATENETEHKAVQPSPADVQGGPPVPASSVTQEAQLRPCPHGCPAPGSHTHLDRANEPTVFGPAEEVAAQEGQPSVESTSDRELPEASVPAGRPGMLTGVGGAPSALGTAGPQGVVLRSVCGWCDAVLREGVEPVTTGICPPCADRMTADTLAAIKVYPPLHVIPAQDRIGGYVIRDGRDRLIADRIVGINPAAALAHTLNNAVHGFGLCLIHLGERRQDGSCFPCSLKTERHPFAAVGR